MLAVLVLLIIKEMRSQSTKVYELTWNGGATFEVHVNGNNLDVFTFENQWELPADLVHNLHIFHFRCRKVWLGKDRVYGEVGRCILGQLDDETYILIGNYIQKLVFPNPIEVTDFYSDVLGSDLPTPFILTDQFAYPLDADYTTGAQFDRSAHPLIDVLDPEDMYDKWYSNPEVLKRAAIHVEDLLGFRNSVWISREIPDAERFLKDPYHRTSTLYVYREDQTLERIERLSFKKSFGQWRVFLSKELDGRHPMTLQWNFGQHHGTWRAPSIFLHCFPKFFIVEIRRNIQHVKYVLLTKTNLYKLPRLLGPFWDTYFVRERRGANDANSIVVHKLAVTARTTRLLQFVRLDRNHSDSHAQRIEMMEQAPNKVITLRPVFEPV